MDFGEEGANMGESMGGSTDPVDPMDQVLDGQVSRGESAECGVSQGAVVVIGGGIAGITVAVEVAEAGLDAHIVESSPSLGGRVAQLASYFPKMCPPSCGLELNYRRIRNQKRVHIHTQSRVTRVEGSIGNYRVSIERTPRFVGDRCTACGACVAGCPVDCDDPHDFGLSKRKAIGLPYPMAFPPRFAIDRGACRGESCGECKSACKYDAIDHGEVQEIYALDVGAIVVATGWVPYDAGQLSLGFGAHRDVVTNVMMERYSSPDGPTFGKIICPSDGREPTRVAFVQCAGSRDVNHLPYCSGVCCSVTMKQVLAVCAALPSAKVTVMYIDIRTMGRLEDLYRRCCENPNVSFKRGKVARVCGVGGGVQLTYEDTLTGTIEDVFADLVVLATGMVPSIKERPLPFDLLCDDGGFLMTDLDGTGVIVAGCAKRPMSVADTVRDATAAAFRAITCATRGGDQGRRRRRHQRRSANNCPPGGDA